MTKKPAIKLGKKNCMGLHYLLGLIVYLIILIVIVTKVKYFRPTGGRLISVIIFFIITGFLGFKYCVFMGGCVPYLSYFTIYLIYFITFTTKRLGADLMFNITLMSHLSISFLFGSLFYNKVIKGEKNRILNSIWIITLTLAAVYITQPNSYLLAFFLLYTVVPFIVFSLIAIFASIGAIREYRMRKQKQQINKRKILFPIFALILLILWFLFLRWFFNWLK